jgi:hypothetical protein
MDRKKSKSYLLATKCPTDHDASMLHQPAGDTPFFLAEPGDK